MPLLPNGQKLFVGINHILEPDSAWYRCPAGCFWYQREDRIINEPPFEAHQQIALEIIYAPVPNDREDAKAFVKVFIGDEVGDGVWWRGDWLNDFEGFEEWTEEDHQVWKEWLASEGTGGFLDQVIEKCQAQAEWMQQNTQLPQFDPKPTLAADPKLMKELGQHWKHLDEALENEKRYRASGNQQGLFQNLHALTLMHARLEQILMIDGPHLGFAHLVTGRNCKLRLKREEAIKHFQEALKVKPFHKESLSELMEVQLLMKQYDKAYLTGKRLCGAWPDEAEAWGSLTQVLIRKKDAEAARRALDRALQLDPASKRLQFIDRNFDRELNRAD